MLSQSLDELDDDDLGEKERREEEELVQANTFQNESMTADPVSGHLMVRSDMMGRSRRKQETDYIFSHTVPPVVPCHVVVHREVIHTQKKAFLLLCRRACVFQSSHRLIWCSIFLHTLLEQTSVEIDKSVLPNRGTVAQGDAQRAQELSVCEKALMMQNLNSVLAFHHHCEVSWRKKKHPKMLLKLLGEMVPLVA